MDIPSTLCPPPRRSSLKQASAYIEADAAA
jgi:hypothetical protein